MKQVVAAAHRPGVEGPCYCGIDVGSTTTKAVLVDGEGRLLAHALQRSGVDYSLAARSCYARVLEVSGRSAEQVGRTVATGYGRHCVAFAAVALTEIHCHAAGCYYHFPRALTVVDMGGQDLKIIELDAAGQRRDFRMNRKCAAGTGAFLEEMAQRLDLELDQLDDLAASTEETVPLGSFCTVFAKTEILAHLRRGVPLAALVRGVFLAVIERVFELAPLQGEVVLTGGVIAHQPTIAALFARKLGREAVVPPWPQLSGAWGAALLARRQAVSGPEE